MKSMPSAVASRQPEEQLSFKERLLFALARDPNLPEVGATAHYTLDNCLHFPRRVFRDFDQWLRGKVVLDHGCGYGWQAVAMQRDAGAARVFGVDLGEEKLDHGRMLARQCSVAEAVSFGATVPEDLYGRFDVVVSLSAFEHYADPVSELDQMRRQLKPGGVLLLAFAEPWWSPFGSHFQGYARIPGTSKPFPWLNVFFSERALLRLRSRYRLDRPDRFEDVEGGLNRMTLRRFEGIIHSSGLSIERVTFLGVKGLPAVTRIPLLREFLTSSVGCVLRLPERRL